MTKLTALFSTFALSACCLLTAPIPAVAADTHDSAAATAPAAPRSDVIRDGERALTMIALPNHDGRSTALTIMYEDADGAQSVTIDPSLVTTRDASALASFLDEVDGEFLSFVRASLADRILHLATPPSAFDRAQLEVLFPGRRFRFDQVGSIEQAPSAPRTE